MGGYKELNPEEFTGSKQDLDLWKIRSTLLRVKRPVRVVQLPRGKGTQPGKKLDPRSPPDLPFDCEDAECDVCFQQFFPAAIEISDARARKSIATLIQTIEEDLQYLRSTIPVHAHALASKWRNKSKAKRREFLTEHADMYPTERAAIHLLDAYTDDCPERANWAKTAAPFFGPFASYVGDMLHNMTLNAMTEEMWRDTWLMPYLDVETLSEDPSRLLGLFRNRVLHGPAEWVGFDDTQLVLSEHLSSVTPAFNKHCVVLQGDDYGSFVPWEAGRAHRWEIVGFTKAQHILTAQARMTSLLRGLASKLLAQVRPSGSVPVVCPGKPWQDHLVAQPNVATLTRSTYLEQPFLPPPVADPTEILEIVTVRWRAAMDEVWLLQTEPAYVQLRVRELASSTFFSRVDTNDRWNWFVDEILLNALRRETWWRQLRWECEQLLKAYQDHCSLLKDKDRRIQYELMLFIVQDCCMELMALQIEVVQFGLPFHRGFEDNYDFHDSKSKRTGQRQPLVLQRDYFNEDPLFWSISCLGFDEWRMFTMDPVFGLRVLETCLARASKTEAARVSQRLLDHVGDLAVVDEVRFRIRCQRSRSMVFDDDLVKRTMGHPARVNYMKKIQKVSFATLNMGLKGRLQDVCQSNPWPSGRKNQSWLDQATAARQSLARLWSRLRTVYHSQSIQAGISKEWTAEQMEMISADQSKEYRDEVEAERRLAARPKQQTPQMLQERDANSNNWTTAITSGRDEKPKRYETLPSKPAKHKTRKLADNPATKLDHVTSSSSEQPLGKAAEIPIAAKILVKKDNLRVFTQMFPAGDDESGRKVAWQHFCSAMVDAGFSMQQGSGSSVCFRQVDSPKDADIPNASIVFHRPHPEPVIDPVMLRSMGKRLKKWFGWDGSLFAVRGKE